MDLKEEVQKKFKIKRTVSRIIMVLLLMIAFSSLDIAKAEQPDARTDSGAEEQQSDVRTASEGATGPAKSQQRCAIALAFWRHEHQTIDSTDLYQKDSASDIYMVCEEAEEPVIVWVAGWYFYSTPTEMFYANASMGYEYYVSTGDRCYLKNNVYERGFNYCGIMGECTVDHYYTVQGYFTPDISD